MTRCISSWPPDACFGIFLLGDELPTRSTWYDRVVSCFHRKFYLQKPDLPVCIFRLTVSWCWLLDAVMLVRWKLWVLVLFPCEMTWLLHPVIMSSSQSALAPAISFLSYHYYGKAQIP